MYDIKEEDLRKMYIDDNMRRSEIAKYYGCSDVLIKKKLSKLGIQKPKSLENENKKRRLTKSCLHCLQVFEVVKFRFDGKWELKFCSHSCSSKYRYLGEDHKRKVANSVSATRRARLKSASTDLTDEEKECIKLMYINCPEGYEVDHIIPISRGGKHHPSNLQYLTISENRRKQNKICSEM